MIHAVHARTLALAVVLAITVGCGSGANDSAPTSGGEPSADRTVVYQLVVRYFGNVKGTNAYDADLATNGVGKFAHVNDRALESLRNLGVTHVWLTGVLQQATNTDYSRIGEPPSDPDVLKGKAGSFFAVEDYFDVSPDYALDPENRMEEFRALVGRIHEHDLKVLIDLVPNHVARTYHSDVRPELDFGRGDDPSTFFDPQNNFYYLVEPPNQKLKLPEPDHWSRPPGGDGTIEREDNDGTPEGDVPRVTGNNVTSAEPSASDWYETVKLNYGYNFETGETRYEPIPDTWKKIDRVVAYWQKRGVDGFRCDFAHLVPVEAWRYLIRRAEQRDEDVYFLAEAFQTPRAPPGFSLTNLVQAGFDAVYDDATYDAVKSIYCCGGSANDLQGHLPGDYMFDNMLRYVENHDERRAASPVVRGEGTGASGFGSATAAKPAAALSFLLGSGPILLFNGQTVGEPGAGREGFDGDDGRTTIFDYWTMPRFAKWVNGHRYDGGQLPERYRSLRRWYGRLVDLASEPGFASGEIYVLQNRNRGREDYTGGEKMFSFLRYDRQRGAAWLVVANFDESSHSPRVRIPREAQQFAGFDRSPRVTFTPALADAAPLETSSETLVERGVEVDVSARSVRVFDVSTP